MTAEEGKALSLIFQYGQIDGAHHKAWVLDQVARVLAGDEYKAMIDDYEERDLTGEPQYEWDTGIAP